MNKQAARVTGVVLSVDTRSGAKRQEDGSVRDWSMTTARVLVGGRDVCDVTLPNLSTNGVIPDPKRGEDVDWLVSVGTGGRYLNIDYVTDWSSVDE